MDEEAVRYLAEHVAKVKLEAAEKEYALSQEVDFLRVQSKEQNDKVSKLLNVFEIKHPVQLHCTGSVLDITLS